MMRIFSLAVLACLLAMPMVGQSAGQGSASGPLTLDKVVQKLVSHNQARARALESYQVKRTYTLDYKGFPHDLHAQLVTEMTYTAPDSKQFQTLSQSGPKILVDSVLKKLIKSEQDASDAQHRKSVDLNTDNYNFSHLVYQPEADGCSYKVSVEPKEPSKYLYRGDIWINDREFAVCRIEAEPAKNPSFWIRSTTISHRYEKIGQFWLPERNKSVSAVRVGGHATLTILYEDYKILKAAQVAP